MPVSQTFRDWVQEQLRPSVPKLTDRRMFGGVGIYSGELFFALLDNDRLYLKANDSNRADFTARGMGAFRPHGDDSVVMQYYEAPLEVIENPRELGEWATKAIEVARSAVKPQKSRAKATKIVKKAKKRSS
jgi:DNA transformation protein